MIDAAQLRWRYAVSGKREVLTWHQGKVDRFGEHFELDFDPDDPEAQGITIALVGKPVRGRVPVEFLIPAGNSKNDRMIAKAVREIEFLLVEKREDYPWRYAQHHCETFANAYSDVRWSFFKKKEIEPLEKTVN